MESCCNKGGCTGGRGGSAVLRDSVSVAIGVSVSICRCGVGRILSVSQKIVS